MEIYLGFDPGGEGHFAWAVGSSGGFPLRVLATGEAGDAEQALSKSLLAIPKTGLVVGAGIDAPLFWSKSGARVVDTLIRQAIKKMGAPSPGGTVQHINSLRGACLVQGILVANLVYEQFSEISITESHPKALLYLLGIANEQKTPATISMTDLSEYASCDKEFVSEHERDAILAAVTAFAQRERRRGWRNLFEEEKEPLRPFNYPVEYWMPWDLVEEHKATSKIGGQDEKTHYQETYQKK